MLSIRYQMVRTSTVSTIARPRVLYLFNPLGVAPRIELFRSAGIKGRECK